MAEKFFLTLIALVLLALILGALVFYKFCYLSDEEELQIGGELLQLEEGLIQDLLKTLEERKERFDKAGLKNYPDLFNPR